MLLATLGMIAPAATATKPAINAQAIERMNVQQLRELAITEEIDLGNAKTQKEIAAKIIAAL